jgi:hypothetical protein
MKFLHVIAFAIAALSVFASEVETEQEASFGSMSTVVCRGGAGGGVPITVDVLCM